MGTNYRDSAAVGLGEGPGICIFSHTTGLILLQVLCGTPFEKPCARPSCSSDGCLLLSDSIWLLHSAAFGSWILSELISVEKDASFSFVVMTASISS